MSFLIPHSLLQFICVSCFLQEPLESDLIGEAFLCLIPKSFPFLSSHSSPFLPSSFGTYTYCTPGFGLHCFVWLVVAPDVGAHVLLEQSSLLALNTLPAPLMPATAECKYSYHSMSFLHPSSESFSFSLAQRRLNHPSRGGVGDPTWSNMWGQISNFSTAVSMLVIYSAF